jgi:hypothetical protein
MRRGATQDKQEIAMSARETVVTFPKADVLRRLALSDSGFIFDPVTGNSFTANSTGHAILRQLQRASEMTRIIDALRQEFAVEPGVAERDVVEFAGLLRNYFK